MENINAILERFTRAEIAAVAAQTQTYPEYSGHTDEIFANLATGKFRVIQSVDGYTVSTDPDLIKVCNSAQNERGRTGQGIGVRSENSLRIRKRLSGGHENETD